jgi:hypothetical protein
VSADPDVLAVAQRALNSRVVSQRNLLEGKLEFRRLRWRLSRQHDVQRADAGLQPIGERGEQAGAMRSGEVARRQGIADPRGVDVGADVEVRREGDNGRGEPGLRQHLDAAVGRRRSAADGGGQHVVEAHPREASDGTTLTG